MEAKPARDWEQSTTFVIPRFDLEIVLCAVVVLFIVLLVGIVLHSTWKWKRFLDYQSITTSYAISRQVR